MFFHFCWTCINTEWKPNYLFPSRTFISNFNLVSPLKLGRIGRTSTGNNQGRFPSWRYIWKKEKHFNYWNHFSSLRNVLLAFSSVWFPHIIDINYTVVKIRSNIKHFFYQQQGKNGEVFPKFPTASVRLSLMGEGQDNIMTLTFGNKQKKIWPRCMKTRLYMSSQVFRSGFPRFRYTYACSQNVT